MTRYVTVALVLVLVLTAGYGGRATTSRAALVCALSQLHLAHALGDMSEPTGQNSFGVRVVNDGPSCALLGYPRVWLEDSGGVIPFVIQHRGDQVVTSRMPKRFVIDAGTSAYVMLNHYRCDAGTVRAVRTIRLGLADTKHRDAVALAVRSPRLGWCGKGDPGSLLSVSPFEPTFRATLRG